jgi:hypothetical protein
MPKGMPFSAEGKIATVLALLGLGGGGALFVLPHPYADIVGWSLIAICAIGLVLVAAHHFEIVIDRGKAVVFSAALTMTLVAAFSGWWLWSSENSVPRVQVTGEKNLPGVQVSGFLRLYDTPEVRRRYIFQISNPEGGKAEFFLSASDIFIFSVTDIHGETYALDVPYGTSGIPIDRYVFLYCDAGIDRKSMTIRLFIDGKQVQTRTFDLPVELGSNKWHITIGADNNGQNNGPFKMAFFGVGHATETESQIKADYELAVRAISALNKAIVP